MKTLFRNLLIVLVCSFGITAQAAVISVGVGVYSPTNYSRSMSLGLPNGGANNEALTVPSTGFRLTLPGSVETLGFCIELGQSLSTGNTYSYENGNSLSRAARGSGTKNGVTVGTGRGANVQTGSSGGIGDLHAARIHYLFDNFWESSTASSWIDPAVRIPAFQLAIWELSHDIDFSLVNNTALTTDFFVTSTSGTADVYNRAATLVASVQAANVSSSYFSSNWEIILLENSSYVTGGAQGVVQDLVYARAITPIPEATTAALTLTALAVFAARRRRRVV